MKKFEVGEEIWCWRHFELKKFEDEELWGWKNLKLKKFEVENGSWYPKLKKNKMKIGYTAATGAGTDLKSSHLGGWVVGWDENWQ